MPATKEVICRRPTCFAKTHVYVQDFQPGPPSFYVYKCPKCGKEVVFSDDAFATLDEIPADGVLAKPLI